MELWDATLRLSGIVADADPGLQVATCPEWTLSELARHVGGGHRWVQRIVATKAQEPVDMSTVRLDYPGTAALRALWLRSGAEMLSDSIRDAGSETAVWSWAEDRTVGFWLRRITHDTIIHRVDAEFTIGVQPALAPPTAVDGISDLLAAVSTLSAVDHPDPILAELRGTGQILQFHATDSGHHWLVSRRPDRVHWTHGQGNADVDLRGAAFDLLLVLYRRAPLDTVEVRGNEPLIIHWIDHSAL